MIDLMFLTRPRDSVRILIISSLPCCCMEEIPETVMFGDGPLADELGRAGGAETFGGVKTFGVEIFGEENAGLLP